MIMDNKPVSLAEAKKIGTPIPCFVPENEQEGRSWVWSVFRSVDGVARRQVCLYNGCNNVVHRSDTTTSNMISHLRVKHKVQHGYLLPDRADREGDMRQYLLSRTPYSKTASRWKYLRDLCVRMVA